MNKLSKILDEITTTGSYCMFFLLYNLKIDGQNQFVRIQVHWDSTLCVYKLILQCHHCHFVVNVVERRFQRPKLKNGRSMGLPSQSTSHKQHKYSFWCPLFIKGHLHWRYHLTHSSHGSWKIPNHSSSVLAFPLRTGLDQLTFKSTAKQQVSHVNPMLQWCSKKKKQLIKLLYSMLRP